MGMPFSGHVVTILDDGGKDVPPGTIGHLVIKNDDPALTLGYRKMEDRWAALNRDGWFYTGDLAYKDEEGYYWYVSRSDDLIKSRAYLISPKEVEEATMEHPAVLEAGVVGVPDASMGQRVRAYITLKEGYQPSASLAEEIIEKVKTVIAPYKAPKEIEFVDELPKTATGKILRRELRRDS
jgi:acetyl-CoA synthetase